jgi:hypothetical protein
VPTPTAPTPNQQERLPWTVSGIVYEASADGVRSLSGVRVVVDSHSAFGPEPTTTDVSGRYSASGLSPYNAANLADLVTGVIAVKDHYSQPCRPRIDQWHGGVASGVDVYLVPDAELRSTGTPASLPMLPTVLSGAVLERTPFGSRPLGGATVIADFGWGMSTAGHLVTYSDDTGRFLLCGFSQSYSPFWDEGATPFPTGKSRLRVFKSGMSETNLDVDVSSNRAVQIELSSR